MAGDAGWAVAQRQECRDWHVTAELSSEEIGDQHELGEGANEYQAEWTTFAAKSFNEASIRPSFASLLPKSGPCIGI